MVAHPSFAVPLFNSFRFGGRILRNRFVMPAMTRRFSTRGVPGSDVGAYYKRRAEGGTGLIITEGGYIDTEGPLSQPDVPVFFGEAALAAWREIVHAVHDAGAGIAPQIWHAHLKPDPDTGSIPPESVAQLLHTYVAAGAEIARAGFDGVEIQGGGKHTADLFTTTGDGEPLVTAVVRSVRREVGDDFPIILRVSEWRRSDGRTPLAQSDAELSALLRPCADAGVSIFHLDTAAFDVLPYGGAFAGDRPLASRVRELTGRPVIAVGGIAVADPAVTLGNLETLARAVEREEIDMLALGRAHLADPAWVEKFRTGRLAEARPYDESLRGTLH
ncbi:12-oxophytodienoate reductase [Pseudochelatococcus lubricantis]|nr:12-oxophytodienoate reductase [Pseudochelatococcus lubricantis]